ncbi:MAG TPA: nucleotidyltransferase family protein [Ktedonobacterales bacterium]|nr:nucleotidyltransferase family protein [Ktedonobacterales bacterium]
MRAQDSERDLLVLVARAASARRDEALAEALAEALTTPLDWERVLDLADVHGCVPLLAAELGAPPRRNAMPASILRRLCALNAALALRRQAQLHALGDVLDALAVRSIQPVLLKGAALAASLYPDSDLRPFQDIDLLLRSPAEVRSADLALRQLGYVRVEHEPAEMAGFHTVYAWPARSITVELHSDILQLGLPMRTASAVWSTRESVGVAGRQVHSLGLEYQVLHLCVHLHTHGYGRLIWLKDLDLLVRARGGAADWDHIWALAETEGVTISMRHALATVRDLLGTPVPSGASHGRRRDLPGEMAHRLLWPRRQVLALRGKQHLRSVRFNPQLGPMGVIPSLVVMGRRRDKLRVWLRPDRGMRAVSTENIVESLSSAHMRGG